MSAVSNDPFGSVLYTNTDFVTPYNGQVRFENHQNHRHSQKDQTFQRASTRADQHKHKQQQDMVLQSQKLAIPLGVAARGGPELSTGVRITIEASVRLWRAKRMTMHDCKRARASIQCQQSNGQELIPNLKNSYCLKN